MQIPEFDLLNSSPLIFPVLECFHIAGLALTVGTIAIVDFRLLGVGLKKQIPLELSQDLAPWTMLGIALSLTTGPLLFLTDPDDYLENVAFQFKMAMLILALIFHFTVRRSMVRKGSGGWAGLLSLALWSMVVAGAIFIAFVV